MHPVLLPGLNVFRRSPDRLQLGTAPGTSMVVGDRPGLVGFLRLLDGNRDATTIACLARERLSSLADPPEALLSALVDGEVVIDATAWDDVDPALRVEARALTASGLHPEVARDRLLRRSQVGIEIRCDSANADLASWIDALLTDLGIDPVRSPSSLVSAVVILTYGAGAREAFTTLTQARVPHLAIAVEGSIAHIGPFVHPTATPCVGCTDRVRSEWDPSWAAIVPQLGNPLAAPDTTGSPAMSATTRATVAAAIAEEVSAFCDDLEPPATRRTLTIGPGCHDRSESELRFHPDCPCRR